MTARVGVVNFPGTNCEKDAMFAVSQLGADAIELWHGDSSVRDADVVIVPGGFAHGDYLRTGAIARFSPVMSAVSEFALAGGPVMGICNGFQILTEAQLLPGALQKNAGLKFLCQMEEIEVVTANSSATTGIAPGTILRIPINHFEGNYTVDSATLEAMKDNDQIVFRYAKNPNGSIEAIAGISNEAHNVVGLMPHPERASDVILGSDDGLSVLKSLLQSAGATVGAA